MATAPVADARGAFIDQDAPKPVAGSPVEFICADCETVERSLDHELPAGWDKFEHRGCTVVRCPDCNEAIEREHRVAALTHAQPANDVQRVWPGEISPVLAGVLGLEMREIGPAASAYRAAAFAIPRKAESERAFVLHRFIALWIEFGDDWREAAARDLQAANDAATAPRFARKG